MSENTLINFLKLAKDNVGDIYNYDSVTVVMGNESCDLDSAVSSIVYAYFLFLSLPMDSSLVIPMINVKRKHYDVKTEVKYFLSKNHITENHLVFSDEIDLAKLHEGKKLKLVLVDHHVLQNSLRDLTKVVSKILDHRPLDTRAAWSEDVSVNIQLVGSCTTLVGQEIVKKGLLKDSQVAMLIYGTIILDTSNFSEKSKKATPLDFEIAEVCEKEGKIELPRKVIYKELVAAKTDTSGLSTYNLLIKDMKIVHTIPIPVLTMSVVDFLERADAEESIKTFIADHNAQMLIILGVMVEEGSQLRNIYIYPHKSQELADFIESALKSNVDPKLDLHTVESKYGGKVFKEVNSYTTRKRLLPIIETAYNEYIKKQTS